MRLGGCTKNRSLWARRERGHDQSRDNLGPFGVGRSGSTKRNGKGEEKCRVDQLATSRCKQQGPLSVGEASSGSKHRCVAVKVSGRQANRRRRARREERGKQRAGGRTPACGDRRLRAPVERARSWARARRRGRQAGEAGQRGALRADLPHKAPYRVHRRPSERRTLGPKLVLRSQALGTAGTSSGAFELGFELARSRHAERSKEQETCGSASLIAQSSRVAARLRSTSCPEPCLAAQSAQSRETTAGSGFWGTSTLPTAADRLWAAPRGTCGFTAFQSGRPESPFVAHRAYRVPRSGSETRGK